MGFQIMEELKINKKNRLIQIEETGDEFQLLEEMGFSKKHICMGCKKPLLDYYKTCRYTSQRGQVPIYICLNCGKRNTEKTIDFRLWHTKETVIRFIKLRQKGYTPYRIVSLGLIDIGMMTSYRWEKRFKEQIEGGRNSSQS